MSTATITQPKIRTRTSKPQPEPLAPEAIDRVAASAAENCKLMADATRAKVVLILASGESHVTGLCQRLGQTQPAVSHHLALLRVSGVIEARREGKHNFYGLSDKGRTWAAALVSVGAN